MICLRRLEKKDAPLMFEWMQDENIAAVFNKDMLNMTIDDARQFCIEAAKEVRIETGVFIHFAISDDADPNDEYRGTISLKNFDMDNLAAEYAISLRAKYHGTETAKKATQLILKKGFYEYGLHRIYLNVLATNQRAIHFYEKNGFKFEGVSRDGIYKDGRYINLMWYSVLDTDFT